MRSVQPTAREIVVSTMSYLTSHRPYDPAVLDEAHHMVANGATLSELADHFGVPIASVELWAACHAEFAAALRVGRAEADDRVERAWYNRCVGYTYESEKIFSTTDGVVRVPTREHVPPDPGACAAWLRNRRPEHWNEKHELNLNGTIRHRGSGENEPVIDLAALGPDEIQREYAEALAASQVCEQLAPPAKGGSR